MSAPAPTRSPQHSGEGNAAFQAGCAAAVRDAKQHRRRNHVLDDLPGLTAFASDSAFLASRGDAPGLREDEQDQYIAGYILAYQQALGRLLADTPDAAVAGEGPVVVGRGRLQPMALRRSHRPARKSARGRR